MVKSMFKRNQGDLSGKRTNQQCKRVFFLVLTLPTYDTLSKLVALVSSSGQWGFLASRAFWNLELKMKLWNYVTNCSHIISFTYYALLISPAFCLLINPHQCYSQVSMPLSIFTLRPFFLLRNNLPEFLTQKPIYRIGPVADLRFHISRPFLTEIASFASVKSQKISIFHWEKG